MDILIVDGYNVIHAWPELNKLKEINLGQARERLIQWMASYAGYKGLEVIVVFDAHMTKENSERHGEVSGIQVVFSQEGETADSVIEKLTYSLIKERKGNVFVATADWAEQSTILGNGAFRISIRELQNDVCVAEQEILKQHGDTTVRRMTLEGRLHRGTIQRLEEIRRRRWLQPPEKR